MTRQRSTELRRLPSSSPPPKPQKPHWAFTAIGIATILGLCYWGELVLAVMLVSVLLAFILAPVMEFFIRASSASRPGRRGGRDSCCFALMAGLVYYSSNQAIIFVQDLSKYTQTIRQEISQVRQQAESLGNAEPGGADQTRNPVPAPIGKTS